MSEKVKIVINREIFEVEPKIADLLDGFKYGQKEKWNIVSKYCFSCKAMTSARDYIRFLETRIEMKDDASAKQREGFRKICAELCEMRHRAIKAENMLIKDDAHMREIIRILKK